MARGAQWVGCPTPPLWVTGNAWRRQLTVVSQPGHSGFQTFLRPFQMLWKVREETAWRDSARSRKKDEVVTQFSAVLSP